MWWNSLPSSLLILMILVIFVMVYSSTSMTYPEIIILSVVRSFVYMALLYMHSSTEKRVLTVSLNK